MKKITLTLVTFSLAAGLPHVLATSHPHVDLFGGTNTIDVTINPARGVSELWGPNIEGDFVDYSSSHTNISVDNYNPEFTTIGTFNDYFLDPFDPFASPVLVGQTPTVPGSLEFDIGHDWFMLTWTPAFADEVVNGTIMLTDLPDENYVYYGTQAINPTLGPHSFTSDFQFSNVGGAMNPQTIKFEFAPAVPDSGTTGALLGVAVGAMAFARRATRKQR